MKKLKILLVFFFTIQLSFAATRTAIKNNGDWSKVVTWSSGIVPTYGDSIVIPANITVTFDLAQNQSYPLINNAPIKLMVVGTLYFPAGKKLSLPCGSIIYVLGWLTVENQTGGANNQSNIINICGNEVWYSGLGNTNDTIFKWDSPLPVSLLSFDVKCNKQTNITWSTATETNNDHFTLERSSDAENWDFVTTMRGAGNSNEVMNYQYTDENSLAGLSYYRLKQTDFDGKSETFSPVSLICTTSQTGDLNIYPNPFQSDLVIQYSNLAEGKASIKVYDTMGNIDVNLCIDIMMGSNDYILNLQTLADGLYNVEFVSGNTSYHQKILKN